MPPKYITICWWQGLHATNYGIIFCVTIMSMCSTINPFSLLTDPTFYEIWGLINPLEIMQNFNIQFIVPLPWNTITTTTTRIPAFWGYPLSPYDYPYYWFILNPKSWQDKVKVTNLDNLLKLIFQCKKNTFWSCLMTCVNLKWRVLLKIESRHDPVHKRADGQADRWTRRNQYTPFQLCWSGGIMIFKLFCHYRQPQYWCQRMMDIILHTCIYIYILHYKPRRRMLRHAYTSGL